MAATRAVQGRMAHRMERPSHAQVYVYGNTVRRLEPERYPSEPSQNPQRKERHRVDRNTLRRNQEKALQVDLPYLAVLIIAACFMLYICVSFLHIQSEINSRMDNIKTMERQLETLKSENDALETSINTSVDLDYVYRVAVEDLGMVYANKDQVLLYNKTESEYVRQNEDIPKY